MLIITKLLVQLSILGCLSYVLIYVTFNLKVIKYCKRRENKTKYSHKKKLLVLLFEKPLGCFKGSGCGGSVSASILSQAGYSVLLIEKGPYVSRLNTSQLEGDAYDTIYENHALQTTADGNIMIFAGSTLGGGSAINYACCIELPDEVRLEWSELGLEHCHPNSSEFNLSQEVVLNRIGAIRSDTIHHNGMNAKLIQGSKALGHKYFETKQNLKDTKHDSAGYTCFGDR